MSVPEPMGWDAVLVPPTQLAHEAGFVVPQRNQAVAVLDASPFGIVLPINVVAVGVNPVGRSVITIGGLGGSGGGGGFDTTGGGVPPEQAPLQPAP